MLYVSPSICCTFQLGF